MDESLLRTTRNAALLGAAVEEEIRRRRLVFTGIDSVGTARAAEEHLRRIRSRSLVLQGTAVQAQDYLRKLGGSAANLNSLIMAQSGLAQLQPSMMESVLLGIESAQLERGHWASLNRSLSETRWSALAAASSGTWATSVVGLTEALRTAGLIDQNPVLSERLLAPYDAYSRFARATLKNLEDAPPERHAALSAALTIAGAEISAAEPLVEEILDEELADEPEFLLTPPRPNAFKQLRSDLVVVRIPVDPTPDQLISLSPTADLMDAGRRFGALITECNVNAALMGREQVFTYTTTMLEALQTLPFTVATDKDALAKIVDALYFVLYEGAGTSKLRYQADGLLTNSDCDVVWRVKHLRNKWLRHDPEHGEERDIRKSRAVLREAFHVLGVQGLPRGKSDYVQIHRALISRAVTLLEVLSQRLIAPVY